MFETLIIPVDITSEFSLSLLYSDAFTAKSAVFWEMVAFLSVIVPSDIRRPERWVCEGLAAMHMGIRSETEAPNVLSVNPMCHGAEHQVVIVVRLEKPRWKAVLTSRWTVPTAYEGIMLGEQT